MRIVSIGERELYRARESDQGDPKRQELRVRQLLLRTGSRVWLWVKGGENEQETSSELRRGSVDWEAAGMLKLLSDGRESGGGRKGDSRALEPSVGDEPVILGMSTSSGEEVLKRFVRVLFRGSTLKRLEQTAAVRAHLLLESGLGAESLLPHCSQGHEGLLSTWPAQLQSTEGVQCPCST